MRDSKRQKKVKEKQRQVGKTRVRRYDWLTLIFTVILSLQFHSIKVPTNYLVKSTVGTSWIKETEKKTIGLV